MCPHGLQELGPWPRAARIAEWVSSNTPRLPTPDNMLPHLDGPPKNPPVGPVIINHQTLHATQELRFSSRFRESETRYKTKLTSFTQLAFHRNLSAHHFRETS